MSRISLALCFAGLPCSFAIADSNPPKAADCKGGTVSTNFIVIRLVDEEYNVGQVVEGEKEPGLTGADIRATEA